MTLTVTNKGQKTELDTIQLKTKAIMRFNQKILDKTLAVPLHPDYVPYRKLKKLYEYYAKICDPSGFLTTQTRLMIMLLIPHDISGILDFSGIMVFLSRFQWEDDGLKWMQDQILNDERLQIRLELTPEEQLEFTNMFIKNKGS